MMVIPRVGHEVLVGFFEGDPDQPVVVGRVYNNTARVPYKLPEHKTRSTWKSDSSPGSDGFNEIMFEDAAGSELVYVQAERDLTKLVKVDEVITVGRNRTTTVGEVDASAIGVKHSVNIKGTPTGTEIVAGRISLTTGAATITLDGPNVTIDAGAGITLNAGSDTVINASASVTVNGGANVTVNGAANVAVSAGASLTAGGGSGTVVQAGGDLVLQGGPMVKINPGGGGGGGGGGGAGAYVPSFGGLPMAVPPEVDLVANMEDARRRRRSGRKNARWFAEKVCEGGEWDYSRLGPEYEDFAAFHLGVVGRAAGFPAGVLARFSGKRRRERGAVHEDWGDPGNGLWGGKWPYGNELEHCQLINAGCEFYDSQKSFRKLSSAGGKDE
jgi:type VI secretion system secreted protein VgrG